MVGRTIKGQAATYCFKYIIVKEICKLIRYPEKVGSETVDKTEPGKLPISLPRHETIDWWTW